MPNAVEINGVGKLFRDEAQKTEFRALKDVNLNVAAGEFVSLIGPSGCGKTTLLKMIDGLIPFEEGEIRVHGQPVHGPGPERAVVFQHFALLPWLTVRENVAFGLEMRGVSKKERLDRATKYLEMVNLTAFADSHPRQISGGMQQRVGLARALAVEPQVLLMDEPFGAVDAQTRNILQIELLSILETSKMSVVFVTHAMDEAVFLSDRVVIMGTRPGHIEEILDVDLPRPRTDETRTNPRLVEMTDHVWSVLRGLIWSARSEPAVAGPE